MNVLEAVKQAGAGFRSLKDAWCDTTTPHGVLMLTILGGLAEFERTLIGARFGQPSSIFVGPDDTLYVGAASYAGDWVTRSIRRRGEPAFR